MQQDKTPVIIDTDPGIDDALALNIALRSAGLDVLLVCSVAGNVSLDLTTANALYLTGLYGNGVPVARGCSGPRTDGSDASSVHGAGGIGSFVIPKHPYSLLSEPGIHAIRAKLHSAAVPVTLITLGPLTNIAALLTLDPAVSQKISRIIAMIGSVDGTGNITPYAEFNAWCDPLSFGTVLKSGIPLVFAPMQLGLEVKLSKSDLLSRAQDSASRDMVSDMLSGYHDPAAGEGFVAMYDANAVEALLHPALYSFTPCRAQLDLTDRPGQTRFIPDPAGPYSFLQIRDRSRLAAAMLDDLLL